MGYREIYVGEGVFRRFLSGSDCVEDTILQRAAADKNFGYWPNYGFVGGASTARTDIVRIKDSAIPSGSILRFAWYGYCYALSGTHIGTGITGSFYCVTPANIDWIEGTGSGINGDTVPSASTWNEKSYQTSSWAGGAGILSVNTDFYLDNFVSLSLHSAGWYSVELPTHWCNIWNLSGNAGFIMRADSSVQAASYAYFGGAGQPVSTVGSGSYFVFDYSTIHSSGSVISKGRIGKKIF